MAKVRMLATSASARGTYNEGTIADVDDDFALQLVEGGAAELIEAAADETEPETTEPETTESETTESETTEPETTEPEATESETTESEDEGAGGTGE